MNEWDAIIAETSTRNAAQWDAAATPAVAPRGNRKTRLALRRIRHATAALARVEARGGVDLLDGARRYMPAPDLFAIYTAAHVRASRWALFEWIVRNATPPLPAPLWSRAHPHMPADSVPALPARWVDESWGNDLCPRFSYQPNEQSPRLCLWIDHPNAAEREMDCGGRFMLTRETVDAEHVLDVYVGDDWQACVERITAETVAIEYAAFIREELDAEQWDAMRAANALPGGCGAEHDFLDANMPAYAAMNLVLERDVLAGDSGMTAADTELWNAATGYARAAYLTA